MDLEGREGGDDLLGDGEGEGEGEEAGEGGGDEKDPSHARRSTEALKQPGLRNEYTQAFRAGIVPLTEAFGLSPRQYAENVFNHAYNRSLAAEPKMPRDLARTFICTYVYVQISTHFLHYRLSMNAFVEGKSVQIHAMCSTFLTEEAVLSAARFILATQIAHEPIVRDACRQHYFRNAAINIRPTPKGIKVSYLISGIDKLCNSLELRQQFD